MIKVLLADDSTELRERLVEMLSQIPRLGVVDQVGSVSAARSILPELHPDLVILDLQMRDGTGIDILRDLRVTHPETKVIVFTNHPEEQYRRRCADLGVTHFLSKSTDLRLLIDIVGELVHNCTASAEAETILLVDTKDVERALTRKLLMQAGYYVLDTGSAEEAIRLGRDYGGPIDLLLADVMMPENSGKEIAARLKEVRPALRVLFMSGDIDEAHAVLDPEVNFIQKPFTWRLAKKVREVLDENPMANN